MCDQILVNWTAYHTFECILLNFIVPHNPGQEDLLWQSDCGAPPTWLTSRTPAQDSVSTDAACSGIEFNFFIQQVCQIISSNNFV
jgi:hypothetical protein